jgi:hypothetical protein
MAEWPPGEALCVLPVRERANPVGPDTPRVTESELYICRAIFADGQPDMISSSSLSGRRD